MRKLVLVIVVVWIGLILIGASLIDEIRSRGVLRVGQDAGYMPLYGTNERGERIGMEAEILEKMADILGVKLEFVIVNWDGIIPALMSGRFDIIWSGMTITPERALRVNFSDPYLTIGQLLIFNNRVFSEEPDLNLINDKSVTIAVQLGTTGDATARRLFPEAQILTFDTMDEAAFQVASGRADVMVFDSIYAYYVARKYDSLETGSNYLATEDLGVAVRKGDLESLLWINTFIRWLEVTESMDSLQTKWLVEYDPKQ